MGEHGQADFARPQLARARAGSFGEDHQSFAILENARGAAQL